MGAVTSEIDISEAVSLSAVDPIFYSQFFFPKTVRQATPPFHRGMWERLDSPMTPAKGSSQRRHGHWEWQVRPGSVPSAGPPGPDLHAAPRARR